MDGDEAIHDKLMLYIVIKVAQEGRLQAVAPCLHFPSFLIPHASSGPRI